MIRVLTGIVAVSMAAGAAFADGDLRIHGGQSVAVPETDSMVTLSDVQDQRCPSDVDCYWEGMMRVELTTLDGAVIVLCNLCDGATRNAIVAGRTVTLVGLEPGRDVLDPLGRLVVLEDYTVVLAVQ